MCDLCGDKIWGLSAKGHTCTDCGYSCHSKCEMKVPASCPGILDKNAKKVLKEERQKKASEKEKELAELPASDGASTLERSSTSASAVSSTIGRSETTKSSISSIGPKRRVLAPPPEKYVSPAELPAELPASAPSNNDLVMAKMIYAFAGDGDGELAVSEGDKVAILEPDGKLILEIINFLIAKIK